MKRKCCTRSENLEREREIKCARENGRVAKMGRQREHQCSEVVTKSQDNMDRHSSNNSNIKKTFLHTFEFEFECEQETNLM